MSSTAETVQSNVEAEEHELYICEIVENEVTCETEDCTVEEIKSVPEVITIEDDSYTPVNVPYDPFNVIDISEESQGDSVKSLIGPFSDNRPICECDIIKEVMANTDTRYLLSLLPDMAEMSPKQKTAFKNRIFQLIDRILNGDSIDVDL